MTPDQIAASGTETAHQRALFAATKYAFWQYGEQRKVQLFQPHQWDGFEYGWAAPLRWFHAIPNGGSRGDDAKTRAIRGSNLLAEGVKPGVADTFMPCPRGRFAGLYIEMKKPGITKASPEQHEFRDFVVSVGYRWELCNDWKQAYSVLVEYLKS